MGLSLNMLQQVLPMGRFYDWEPWERLVVH